MRNRGVAALHRELSGDGLLTVREVAERAKDAIGEQQPKRTRSGAAAEADASGEHAAAAEAGAIEEQQPCTESCRASPAPDFSR